MSLGNDYPVEPIICELFLSAKCIKTYPFLFEAADKVIKTYHQTVSNGKTIL